MGKNCNGFNNQIGGNNKIAKALDIKEELDIDCLMYCKHRINFRHKENDLKQMFQQELACTAIAAHNVHKGNQAGRVQEGGTGSICFGEATGYIKKVWQDEEGLGHLCWILLGGAEGHNTHIITAYNPCRNKNLNSGTSYQQQRYYFITKKKDLTCLLILFCKHLIKHIKQWQASEERIVLFMDHNKHTIEGPLGKALADKDGPALCKAIKLHTGASPGATFFRGLRPIDGLWASKDLDISNACVMPFGFGVGDHCAFILDIPLESLVGVNPVKIVRPVSCRLNSQLPKCGEVYVENLEANLSRHRLLEHLYNAHTGKYSAKETAKRVIIIDKEGKAYMHHAKKIYRKMKCC